jgi:hypothetical protein
MTTKIAVARPWVENTQRCPATRTWDAPGEVAVCVDRCVLDAGHEGEHRAALDAAYRAAVEVDK